MPVRVTTVQGEPAERLGLGLPLHRGDANGLCFHAASVTAPLTPCAPPPRSQRVAGTRCPTRWRDAGGRSGEVAGGGFAPAFSRFGPLAQATAPDGVWRRFGHAGRPSSRGWAASRTPRTQLRLRSPRF